MEHLKKINISFILVISLLLNCLLSCNNVNNTSIINNNVSINEVKDQIYYIEKIDKYGNIILSISGRDFLKSGFEFGDVINASIEGVNYDMPICPNYTDVAQGDLVCRVWIEDDVNEDSVLLCINMGDFATDKNIAKKEIVDSASNYKWVYNVNEPCEVKISMKEKGGYKEEYLIHTIMSSRSNDRNDYEDLSDGEFTNFRMIKTTNIKEGILYRSSSPVNPKYGRNNYADEEARKAKINAFINLADDIDKLKSYEGFNDTYYSTKDFIPLNLSVALNGEEYKKGVAKAIRFINEHDGPYLIHCDEGKDRAGFMAAILECMMGASAEEVVNDYMITYYNYYHIKKDDVVYENIKKLNIERSLTIVFGVSDIYKVDLYKECEEYLLSIGLSKEEIDLARKKLS